MPQPQPQDSGKIFNDGGPPGVNRQQKRVKPAIPAKPAYIPPLPNTATARQQTVAVSVASAVNIQPPVKFRSDLICGDACNIVLSSPLSAGCTNDCCRILNSHTDRLVLNSSVSVRPAPHDHCTGQPTSESRSLSPRLIRPKEPPILKSSQHFGTVHSSTSNLPAQPPSSSSDGATAPGKSFNIQTRALFEQSTKNLEQILAQRIDKDNQHHSRKKRTSPIAVAASSHHQRDSAASRQQSTVTVSLPPSAPQSSVSTVTAVTELPTLTNTQKQIQFRLQDEMKQQCKSIQEKHLIEKRWPQQHYKPATGDDECVSTNPAPTKKPGVLFRSPKRVSGVFFNCGGINIVKMFSFFIFINLKIKKDIAK